ncbi:MAG: ribosome recycling factor [Epulopiscium sp.]|nr:ribosome recycling factor [Candidatus Epulonipiscium sp.]
MDAKEYEIYEKKMKKTINALEDEFNTIRAGRANPHILDKITVNYYGVQTPLQQVGNITVPEARIIQIQPWDSSLLKEIEKAIMASDIGINPNNDGKVIRLIFPELTEERRKQLTKEVKKKGEEAKVAIRNIRRDALEHFKKAQKNGEITEDDLKSCEEDIQKITDRFISDIDKRVEAKSKDILSV